MSIRAYFRQTIAKLADTIHYEDIGSSPYYHVLKNYFKPLLFVFGSMTTLYGFIFVIIQLENYALLVGSIGLFVILAIIMFTSKKIDWTGQQAALSQ